MNARAVEVVIAVHSTTRPVRQAVESVLEAGEDAAALVVAHEVAPEAIAALLAGLLDDGRVRVVGFSDGIRSPAGPFNHGLALADAEFVSILGSDDRLEAGALDAALTRARTDGADAVILPIRLPGVLRVRSPLTRPGRTARLDPASDRLFGRTAPLALMRRTVVESYAPVFDPDFETGEDLEFGARLWSTASVSYGHLDPAYVGGTDGSDRVTDQDPDLRRTLPAALALAGREWVAALDGRVRRSLATKILRVSVLGALTLRARDPRPLEAAEIQLLAETRRRWVALDAAAEASFPLADRRLLDACAPDADDAVLRDAVLRRASASLPARTLTRNPLALFGRDTVLRRYAIYARLRREEREAR